MLIQYLRLNRCPNVDRSSCPNTPIYTADEAFEQDYNEIDLILSDIFMHPMDGFQIYTYLRETMGVTRPIIAVTALAITGDKEKILMHGFDAYISKPIYADELYRVLNGFIIKTNTGSTVQNV